MEVDVHLSKDNQVVVVHDGDLERMCGQQYKGLTLKSYDFEDLPPIQT